MSTFISYAAVEQEIAGAFERSRSARPEHHITRYTSYGGGEGAPQWKTIGFYARISPHTRLVCEAFHDEKRSAAVIRVFCEGTVEPMFARKWAGDDARFSDAVQSAAEAFAVALPEESCPGHPSDDMSWLPVSDEERATFQRALNPLPPPFSLAATQAA
jgi:hypothetical protein